jgi:hypothetical protein
MGAARGGEPSGRKQAAPDGSWCSDRWRWSVRRAGGSRTSSSPRPGRLCTEAKISLATSIVGKSGLFVKPCAPLGAHSGHGMGPPAGTDPGSGLRAAHVVPPRRQVDRREEEATGCTSSDAGTGEQAGQALSHPGFHSQPPRTSGQARRAGRNGARVAGSGCRCDPAGGCPAVPCDPMTGGEK